MTRLGMIGGGRMGEAMIRGLLEAQWPASDIAIAESDPTRRHALETQWPEIRVVPSPAWAVAEANVVVLAVKPNDVVEALNGLAAALAPDALVVSIAAGVTLATLQAVVAEQAIVRAMPNTPAIVGEGAAAIAPGVHATDAHLALAEQILGAFGLVVRVQEPALDAVTGLSGSGPAYLFLVAEALIDAGVLVGLDRDDAQTLAIQTLYGASKLLATGHGSPETLRAMVTSPGGTTAAGVHVLEQAGVRAAFADAVVAATNRSAELGRGE